MCGIACLIEHGRRFEDALLAGIDADLFHRGPDSGGVLSEEGVAMVFRRLAIMDPTPGADQPMHTEDGTLSLVFNGEIYNFRALRRELEAAGARFRTGSDTEVVLEGYRHWGTDVFGRLEGMFALAILDRKRGRVMAARDPLGIKPLYVARKGTLTAFASEIRPLTRLVGAEADTEALPELLAFGWAAGRKSNYRGIERVPGGTWTVVDLAKGWLGEYRYCDPLDTLGAEPPSSEAESHDAVRASLDAHLMSDVGYSVQFSGGVDSSLVLALATETAGAPLDSYAVKLDDQRFDESRYRAPIVERYHPRHVEHRIDGAAFADDLPGAVRAMEGPVPHGGCVTLYSLCREISAKHKVVLTGEGADECFGGYIRYAHWKKLAAQEKLDRLWPAVLPMPNIWPFKSTHRLHGRDFAAYAAMYETPSAMAAVFPELLPPPPGAREAASKRFSNFADRLFAVDQTSYLESLLVRQDKMSMAHAIEARVPFVHMPLWAVANRLPRNIRVPGGETKPVLKRFAEKYLPADAVHRRKIGLRLPYADWAGDENGLGRYLDDLTDPNGRLRAFAAPGKLDDVVARFRKGEREDLPRIFALINMELWLRDIGTMPKPVTKAAA